MNTKRKLLDWQTELSELIDRSNQDAQRQITTRDVLAVMILTVPELQTIDHPVQVWDYELDNWELKQLVVRAGEFIYLAEVRLDNHLTFNGMFITKADVRMKGQIWRVYKYDHDPFPSNPHAHNLDQNVKLHLGTGELYRGRKLKDVLSRKIFMELRDRFVATGVVLPPLEI